MEGSIWERNHVDVVCPITTQLLSVFDCFNLSQHVNFPTHSCGHILDLICSSGVGICSISSSDTGISDHKLLDFNFSLPLHKKSAKTVISYRNFNNVDISSFCSSIASSNLSDVFDLSSPSLILSKFNSILSDITSVHAPVKTRNCSFHSHFSLFPPTNFVFLRAPVDGLSISIGKLASLFIIKPF